MMSETLTPIQIPGFLACSRWRFLWGNEAGLYFAFDLRGFFFFFLPYATGDSESRLFHEDHMLREMHDGKRTARSCPISLGDVLQT